MAKLSRNFFEKLFVKPNDPSHAYHEYMFIKNLKYHQIVPDFTQDMLEAAQFQEIMKRCKNLNSVSLSLTGHSNLVKQGGLLDLIDAPKMPNLRQVCI